MFNKEEIKDVIPYTGQFLLIDRVVELRDNLIIAARDIKEEDLKGHFTDFSIMPACLIVEGIGQAATFLIRKKLDNHEKYHILMYKVNSAKFVKPVLPGMELRYEVMINNMDEKFAEVSGKAVVNDEVANCSMTLAIVEKEWYNDKIQM